MSLSKPAVDPEENRFSSFARHEALSSSEAAAPLALLSAPQAAFEVTMLADVVDAGDGLLSLREAVREANATPGSDTITFADSIRGGTIELTEDLPTITDDLVIDGDPLDRGSGGIVLDGAYTGPTGASRVLTIDGAEVLVSDLTITKGRTGIAAYSADLALHRVAIDDFRGGAGEAYDGAVGLSIFDSTLAVHDSSITRLSGGLSGGVGLFFSNSDVKILRGEIADIFGFGADGISGSGGNLMVADSTIKLVQGYVSTYGIELHGVALTLVNSTLANNGNLYGPGEFDLGGAISLDVRPSSYVSPTYGSADIINSTITGNTRAITADVLTADVTISNSIVDGSVEGLFTSNHANAFTDLSAFLGILNPRPGDRLTSPDDLFALVGDLPTGVRGGLLADNGGPTETVALRNSIGNPAIDRGIDADALRPGGTPLAFDQRGPGFPRISEAAVDIGAFEFQGPPTPPDRGLVVTTLQDELDANGLVSLREAIETANTTAGADTITFAESIRGGTAELPLGSLTITDDVTIDGDPLDRGPNGIVIDGDFVGGRYGHRVSGANKVVEIAGAIVGLEDLTITGGGSSGRGTSYGNGVGIEVSDASLRLDRVNVANNDGAGVQAYDSELTIIDSTLEWNIGKYTAFGVNMMDSDLTMHRSTVAFNIANFAGVGILARNGDLHIIDSTIHGNSAFDYSRGIDLEDGILTLINSTLVRNEFGGDGDAEIEVTGAMSSASILNTTITTGPEASALVVGNGADATVANTILDGPVEGAFTSNGANVVTEKYFFSDNPVVQPGDAFAFADEVFALTEDLGGNNRGGVLADNGGPTETVALSNSPDNPALDGADPADAPATDQRGEVRGLLPDVGAFELGPTTLPPLAEGVPLPNSEIVGAPRSNFVLGAAGDAVISFVDEVAAFQSSLGVYLIQSDGTIGATRWAFDRIEHSEPNPSASESARPGGGPLTPGDSVLLSDLFDPWELQPDTEFGLFLVADGAAENPFIVYDGGTLAFRSAGGAATVTDRVPELVHIAENGIERVIEGNILHTVDAGSPNPLSNTLNLGGTGQVTSGLLDGAFTVAFEDKPLNGSDRDFNDALFAVDLLDAEDADVLAASATPSGATPSGATPASALPGEASFSTAQVEHVVTAEEIVAA